MSEAGIIITFIEQTMEDVLSAPVRFARGGGFRCLTQAFEMTKLIKLYN